MNLKGTQELNLNWIVGSLFTNTSGTEFRCTGFSVDLENHLIIVNLNLIDSDKTVGMDWNLLKHWSIQLQGGN
tara:strand:+ start:1233 stop:1451 length:219 start_codon:yes stop_codon:yes gene_type:complete